ncbi:hypothetical protein VB757_18760 [Synechococcus sp. BA-132 BA5]|nr:hypothetical protein [Synechococcus sp. BA-132 BA5]
MAKVSVAGSSFAPLAFGAPNPVVVSPESSPGPENINGSSVLAAPQDTPQESLAGQSKVANI